MFLPLALALFKVSPFIIVIHIPRILLLDAAPSDGESNGVAAPAVPAPLLLALGKTMNHSSNEIKTLTTSVFIYLAKNAGQPLDLAFIKPVLAQLINGTKEKNSAVRASSEQALVALLRLRHGQVGEVKKLAYLHMVVGGVRCRMCVCP